MMQMAPPETAALNGGSSNSPADVQDIAEELGLAPEDLLPMEYSDLSVPGMGNGNSDKDTYAYSTMLARVVVELGISDLATFIRQYVPDEHNAKLVLQGLLDLGDRELASPACRRQLRFEEAHAQAEKWAERLGKDYVDQKEKAEELVNRWSGSNIMLTGIRLRRLRDGLGAVKPMRARWYTAMCKQELVEQEAATLHPHAYEYYRASIDAYRINREQAEDLAMHKKTQDHSILIKRLREGKATNGEVATQSPWAFITAIRFALANAGAKNPFWEHQRSMFNGPGGGGNSAVNRRLPMRRRQAEMATNPQGPQAGLNG